MQGVSNPSASRVSWQTPGDTSRATRISGLSFISSLKRKTCPSAGDRNPSYLGWKGWGKKESSAHAREVSWACSSLLLEG